MVLSGRTEGDSAEPTATPTDPSAHMRLGVVNHQASISWTAAKAN